MRPEGIIEKAIKKIKPNQYKYVAAATAAVLILFIFSSCNMLSNGTNTIIGPDMEQQYLPFIKYLIGVLKGKNNLWFSWGNSLGQGMEGTLAYYTFSPINIVYLFFPESMILSATACVIVIKVALASFFMQLFLSSFLNNNHFDTVFFSVLYSLCAFQVVYYSAMNLVDSVYLLPLIMLGIVKLIRDRKAYFLFVSYIILFLYNFYMGYIVGICSFVLGLSYYIYTFSSRDKNHNRSICINYFGTSICSLAITSIIWFPAAYQLFFHIEDDISYSNQFILDPILIINNLFCGQYQSLNGNIPYVYCGLFSLILLVIFFFNTRIRNYVKIYATLIIALFFCIMCIKPINFFFHAFDTPQSIGFRYSFVLSFIICIIACYSFEFIRFCNFQRLIISFLILILLYFVGIIISNLKNVGFNTNENPLIIFINIILILVYGLLLFGIINRKLDLFNFRIILMALIVFELAISYFFIFGFIGDTKSEESYFVTKELENNTISLLPNSDASDFYRVQALCLRNMNIGTEYGLNTIESYDNFMDSNLQGFFNRMGMETYIHHFSSRGMNDIMRAILGVKYLINFEIEDINGSYWKVYDEDNQDVTVYHYYNGIGTCPLIENDYTLSLGFMTYGDIKDFEFDNSPFENQNLLLSKLCGEDIRCYESINTDILCKNSSIEYNDDNKCYELKVKDSCSNNQKIITTDDPYYRIYNSCIAFRCPDNGRRVYGYFNRISEGKSGSYLITSDADYLRVNSIPDHNLAENYITELGMNNNGEYEILLYLQDNKEDYFNNYYFAEYNQNEFERAYSILKSNQLNILNLKNNGYLKGEIDVTRTGTLFMSIPYNKGWVAYVDGEKRDIIPLINDTFCGINLECGKHCIEIYYNTPGKKEGRFISIIGLIGIFHFVLKCKKYKKGDTLNGYE